MLFRDRWWKHQSCSIQGIVGEFFFQGRCLNIFVTISLLMLKLWWKIRFQDGVRHLILLHSIVRLWPWLSLKKKQMFFCAVRYLKLHVIIFENWISHPFFRKIFFNLFYRRFFFSQKTWVFFFFHQNYSYYTAKGLSIVLQP